MRPKTVTERMKALALWDPLWDDAPDPSLPAFVEATCPTRFVARFRPETAPVRTPTLSPRSVAIQAFSALGVLHRSPLRPNLALFDEHVITPREARALRQALHAMPLLALKLLAE